MSAYIIAASKSWNIDNAQKTAQRYPQHDIKIISRKEELDIEMLRKFKPKYIFFPHWSWLIPSEIYENFDCVVFHMTDLPFGRGGSPLQNLIVRGIYDTKISAIHVDGGIDTGAVYFKEPINISTGSAEEILKKVSQKIFDKMIPAFIEGEPEPEPQQGTPVVFKRRKPEQSLIPGDLSPRCLYDYIRMLDGEGYPTAFSVINGKKVYFRNARFKDGKVYADAEFEADETRGDI